MYFKPYAAKCPEHWGRRICIGQLKAWNPEGYHNDSITEWKNLDVYIFGSQAVKNYMVGRWNAKTAQ